MIQTIKNCLIHSSGSGRNFTAVVVFTTGGPSHVLFFFFCVDDAVHTKVGIRVFLT